MSGDQLRVLFLSHDATRSGAPLVLLQLVRWLRDRHDVEPSFALGAGGPLVGEFRTLGPTGVATLPRGLASLLRAVRPTSVRRPVRRWAVTRRVPTALGADLVYANTLASGRLLAAVAHPDVPVITHAHEMRYAVASSITSADVALVKRHTSHYVVAAEAIGDMLVEDHAVPPGRVLHIPPFVAMPDVPAPPTGEERARWRSALGLPADGVVVGAAGGLAWHKGPDLFLRVASEVASLCPDVPIHFCWLGGGSSREWAKIDLDRRLLGGLDHVRFLGARADAPSCFAAFDILALTSREDSFPLVMLENAVHANPTVAFDRTGGAASFVGKDAGVLVPYPSVAAFASAVVELATDAPRRADLGGNALAKVRTEHHVDVLAPRIAALMAQAARSSER